MHRNDFLLRDALARDLDAMVGLLRQLFSIESDFKVDERKQRHGLAALMADHGRSIIRVAEVNNTVVGMCTAQINISTAEGGMSALVEDVVVETACRGRGIGSALLSSVIAWAKERQCVRMQLLADGRNDRAFEFYERAGWKKTGMVCLMKKIYGDRLDSMLASPTAALSARR